MTELSMTREKASARPPRIMVLTVLPSREQNHEAVASAEIGNGEQYRAGGSHAAEKKQNHEAGQHQADDAFMHHRVQGLP